MNGSFSSSRMRIGLKATATPLMRNQREVTILVGLGLGSDYERVPVMCSRTEESSEGGIQNFGKRLRRKGWRRPRSSFGAGHQ